MFPKLGEARANLNGEGVELELRFIRIGGMAVTCVDDGPDVSAVRVLDLHKKYDLTASELAAKLRVTPQRATAMRRSVGVDTNPDMPNTFHMGKVRYLGYFDNAYTAILAAVRNLGMGGIRAVHRSTNKLVMACTQSRCAAVLPAC